MTRIRFLLLPALAALVLLAQSAANAATTARVSVDSTGVQASSGASGNPTVSADGRFVAFESSATNLVSADTNNLTDIFLHDLQNSTTERVSVDSAEAQADGDSRFAAVSANGRFIVFISWATNLVAVDTNGYADIFLRDRQNGTTERVSVDGSGTQSDGNSFDPSISADGRLVAFQSFATNLVAGDTNGFAGAFVRDRQWNSTERISVDSAGQASGGASGYPVVSANGRFVAFQSSATNLVAGDGNLWADTFVRDLSYGTTTRVSLDSAGNEANGGSVGPPAISGDGRFVAFTSDATNLVTGDTNTWRDIFVRDRDVDVDGILDETGAVSTERVSVDSSGGQGNGYAGPMGGATISVDGRFVGFASDSTNLVPGDTNGARDIFVRDRVAGYTVRASLAGDGSQAWGHSAAADYFGMSGDGDLVAFASYADNLVPGDTNWAYDIFVRSADDDGDKILEPQDNCPYTANRDQLNSDGDADGNACDDDDDNDSLPDFGDSCPVLAEDFDSFQDADGCPDNDNDGDGILDFLDEGQTRFDPAGTLPASHLDCRNLAEDIDAFKDTDGCPEPDNDNDSFPDTIDRCPGSDATAGADGMLSSPQDLNHNGIRDGAETPLTSDDSVLTFEDNDGVLDTDGCHDSPGEDFDADGFTDDNEALFIGTNPGYPCGVDSWPADLFAQGLSFNKINVQDITSFIAPVRHLNTNPGDADYNKRWDISPGRGAFSKDINVTDLTTIVTVRPPMLNGERAMNQTCPMPPQ